ncbi:BNI3L protein, partial [Glaucidium brasilianum]|nr:BNI3L protein [Glaucidium brasilianum]
MLLEAQLETESGDGAVFMWGSPARGDNGAIQASEQPGESDRLPPCSQRPPGCPHLRQVRERHPPSPCAAPRAVPRLLLALRLFQRDVPEGAEWREQHLPAPLGWAGAPRPQHLSPKEFAFVCSPQPVLWSLQGGAVGRKKRLFSSELLLLFIPSLLLSHVLTLGLGIYIGKRLAASSANPL